ncbi:hypothetical protein COCOBI_09-0340 [Coccomyxa sp. Obi]|nr:hypothetical protein COCOBI_09-0340 [Coccomyxa sp. Obi]
MYWHIGETQKFERATRRAYVSTAIVLLFLGLRTQAIQTGENTFLQRNISELARGGIAEWMSFNLANLFPASKGETNALQAEIDTLRQQISLLNGTQHAFYRVPPGRPASAQKEPLEIVVPQGAQAVLEPQAEMEPQAVMVPQAVMEPQETRGQPEQMALPDKLGPLARMAQPGKIVMCHWPLRTYRAYRCYRPSTK